MNPTRPTSPPARFPGSPSAATHIGPDTPLTEMTARVLINNFSEFFTLQQPPPKRRLTNFLLFLLVLAIGGLGAAVYLYPIPITLPEGQINTLAENIKVPQPSTIASISSAAAADLATRVASMIRIPDSPPVDLRPLFEALASAKSSLDVLANKPTVESQDLDPLIKRLDALVNKPIAEYKTDFGPLISRLDALASKIPTPSANAKAFFNAGMVGIPATIGGAPAEVFIQPAADGAVLFRWEKK